MCDYLKCGELLLYENYRFTFQTCKGLTVIADNSGQTRLNISKSRSLVLCSIQMHRFDIAPGL